MEFQKLFEKFNLEGHLLLPDTDVAFKEIPWLKHPRQNNSSRMHRFKSV